MFYENRISQAFIGVGCCALLSGCFIKEVAKSELSSYNEPKQEDAAHLRVSGSRNIKVYLTTSQLFEPAKSREIRRN